MARLRNRTVGQYVNAAVGILVYNINILCDNFSFVSESVLALIEKSAGEVFALVDLKKSRCGFSVRNIRLVNKCPFAERA